MDHQRDQEALPRNEEHLYHLLKGDGWAVARDILQEKLKTLRDVTNIPEDLTNEQLVRETSGRIYTVALIDEWFKELETRAENFATTLEQPDEDPDHIIRE